MNLTIKLFERFSLIPLNRNFYGRINPYELFLIAPKLSRSFVRALSEKLKSINNAEDELFWPGQRF